MSSARSFRPAEPGPFRVEYLRPGDPYELSDGHAVVAEPAGPRHGRRNLTAASILDSDPAVEAAGVDVGFALDARTLRAPDVAVGNLPDGAAFAPGAPALAVEYVERGRDEADLQRKVAELLAGGTKAVWVVRLGGERRVEVHRAGQRAVIARSGEELTAPGILRNPVPVDALYDRGLAHETTLRNLLQRRGYASLDAVRAEGTAVGTSRGATEQARASLRRVLRVRGIALTREQEATIGDCGDLATLDRWLDRALVATSARGVFAGA